ncbi:C-type lectin domain family 19 member A-like [Diadema antillarum]|uniref:C-type lectin domain family 19 member A-like n=1 Tax=Diadema antillarum TaxID=105358 RepID=UPI003A8C2437
MKHLLVTLGLLIALSAGAARGTGCHPVSCPSGWSLFESSCYRYYEERVDQPEALRRCLEYTDEQGSLVSIANDAENVFAYDLFRSIAGDTPEWKVDPRLYGYWMGLHRNNPDGEWEWTDGTPAGYFNWQPNEPNDVAGIENCVQVLRRHATDDDLRGWNDLRCTGSYLVEIPFMCEMPASS